MKTLLALLTAGTLLAVPGLAQQPPTPTLYDRLGGVYPIASVVDEFINRLLVNDVLNANPAIAAARQRPRLPDWPGPRGKLNPASSTHSPRGFLPWA